MKLVKSYGIVKKSRLKFMKSEYVLLYSLYFLKKNNAMYTNYNLGRSWHND